MESVKDLLQTTIGEVEKLLKSHSVVGDPIKVGNETVIPLMSLGFGFGAGSGKGTDKNNSNEGGGGGAGGGIKPVAVIIVSETGETRVQPITGGFGDALGKLASSVGDAIRKESKH